MSEMDTRKLIHFVEIVDEGSISRAAAKLRLSQPALTKSVRALEADLQVELLRRSTSGVTPTRFGSALYGHARAIVAEIGHAEDEIRALGGNDRAQLRIGVLPSVSGVVLARAVANIVARDRLLHIRVAERQHYELIPALRRREFDFVIAIADKFEPDPAVHHRTLFRDELRIVARAGHPLTRLSTVTAGDLVDYPWAHPVVGTTNAPILRQLFKASGMEPPVAQVECGSVQFAKTLMLHSDALGLMPAHTISAERSAGTLCCLPVRSNDLKRTVGVYYNANRPPNLKARMVLREIRAVFGGMQRVPA